jgi:hypothetical protein
MMSGSCGTVWCGGMSSGEMMRTDYQLLCGQQEGLLVDGLHAALHVVHQQVFA